jgi:hypothetical protein
MYKKILDGLIDQPFLTSLFLIDFFVLLVHRPPVLASLLLLVALVGMSMYLGQKLALFKV